MEPLDSNITHLRQATADVFELHDLTTGFRQTQTIRLRGRLLAEAKRAYDLIAPRFRALGYTPLFRRDGDLDVILALPGTLAETRPRVWLAMALFLATAVSAVFAGSLSEAQGDLSRLMAHPLAGWPFAASLLAILLAHELGHYFVARHFGTAVSLPYFIPMPLVPFGTLGAVIRMKSPPKNRRQLLAIAAAGPLAGLVLAIPILVIGLVLSEVLPFPPGNYTMEGNSLLYVAIKFLLFRRLLPSGGEDVFLHQVAFAGWVGLLVTGLNLIPAGQLDGGHAVYALIGRRAGRLTLLMVAGLIVLGFLKQWEGWYLWAFLILIFGRAHAEPLDDITRLDTPRRLLAMLVIILFILTFVPVPLTLH